jgi:hypothetical protein
LKFGIKIVPFFENLRLYVIDGISVKNLWLLVVIVIFVAVLVLLSVLVLVSVFFKNQTN